MISSCAILTGDVSADSVFVCAVCSSVGSISGGHTGVDHRCLNTWLKSKFLYNKSVLRVVCT